MFALYSEPFDIEALKHQARDISCGGYCSFEGGLCSSLLSCEGELREWGVDPFVPSRALRAVGKAILASVQPPACSYPTFFPPILISLLVRRADD